MSAEISRLLALAGCDERPLLLVLDEGSGDPGPCSLPLAHALGNRLDICRLAEAGGWPTSFCDFDFAAVGSIGRVLYRVSKEKKVVEHVLQRAWERLPVGGELWLAGYKNEGIKTFAKRMKQAWPCREALQRAEGQLHVYTFTRLGEGGEALDDGDYTPLREIANWQGDAVWSKPGIFAWDRLDQGSLYLLQHLNEFLPGDCTGLDALDLGCGNGLLALALVQAGCRQVIATDNNAAAISAATRTLASVPAAQQVRVVAADCGDTVSTSVDLVLCNPPFHQGFSVEQDLTDRFLAATRRLLRPGGRALFVVNAFIPLEKKAASLFSGVDSLAFDGRYRLVTLTR